MDPIPFIPLLLVMAAASGYRFLFRGRPMGLRDWLATFVALAIAVFLPLDWGIWLPDIPGQHNTLASATTPSGHRITVVQYWNHIDFYTTEARVTAPNGVTTVMVQDDDASKEWSTSIQIDPSQNRATFLLSGGRRTGMVTW
jgi:hypothetical protein